MTWLDRLRGLTIAGSVTVRFDLVPDAPVLTAVTFKRGSLMAAVKGLTHFDSAAAAGVDRKIYVVLNGAAPVTVDATDPTVEFDCNEGDVYSIDSDDTNASGTGPRSPALTGTVPTFPPPPPPVPGAPPLSSVTFRLA
jgi:hypothetical protein